MSRGEELYKDKIEVSLDGRQIFYLFFGGAVIACLVFVLGVLVGKRVEARAHVDRAATTAARDPLAALDALDATTRAAPAPAQGQVERAVADLDGAQRAAKQAAVAPSAPVASPSAPAAAPAPSPSHEDDPASAPAADPPKKKKHHDDAADEPAAKPADDHDDKPAKKDDKAAKSDDSAKKDEKKKAHYTLQLSSFQDKGEAQAFLDGVKGSGYSAYLVEADVDGKGTFWRVRLGSYPSYDDAIDAKTEFEAKVKKVAYVTKL